MRHIRIIEIVRLTAYVVNVIILFILSGYFFREYLTKRLRASLAWALGFLFLAIVMIDMTFIVATEVSRSMVILGSLFNATMIAFLYYGASLLFFEEGSFYREKMAFIYFIAVLLVELILTIRAPAGQIVETVRTPINLAISSGFLVVGILFYKVSRKLPKVDPRRRTFTLISVAWIIVFSLALYWAFFWGEFYRLEIGWILFSVLGWALLLYGMTTAKTIRR